jgi:hypothetical protein
VIPQIEVEFSSGGNFFDDEDIFWDDPALVGDSVKIQADLEILHFC